MADASIFQITNGVVSFKLVDTVAVGYMESWQAPGGKTLTAVTMADYESTAVSANWNCNVLSAALSPSAQANDVSVPATFCNPAKTIPQPGESTFSLDLEILQMVAVQAGLDAYLFGNGTKEAYFILGLAGTTAAPAGINAPKAMGRCRLLASAFGGAARENLTATISLPLSRKPDIAYGSGAMVTLLEGYTAPPDEVGATTTESSSKSKSAA